MFIVVVVVIRIQVVDGYMCAPHIHSVASLAYSKSNFVFGEEADGQTHNYRSVSRGWQYGKKFALRMSRGAIIHSDFQEQIERYLHVRGWVVPTIYIYTQERVAFISHLQSVFGNDLNENSIRIEGISMLGILISDAAFYCCRR